MTDNCCGCRQVATRTYKTMLLAALYKKSSPQRLGNPPLYRQQTAYPINDERSACVPK